MNENTMLPNCPRISLVTPNYNLGAYLEETINSILLQEYPNIEYIVIDGGSTDNSLEIINKYKSQLAYWKSEPDKGMYDALQKGFDQCTGEIMGWLNSDDTLMMGSLSIIAEIFNTFPEVEWITASSGTIDERGRIVGFTHFRKWTKFDFYRRDFQYIHQESTFWRRGLWERAGSKVDTSLKFAGDLELWNRFFKFTKLYSVDTLLGNFRFRHNNQLSNNYITEYLLEANQILNQNNINPDEAYIIKILERNPYSILKSLPILRRKYYKIEREKKVLIDQPKFIRFNRDSFNYELM